MGEFDFQALLKNKWTWVVAAALVVGFLMLIGVNDTTGWGSVE